MTRLSRAARRAHERAESILAQDRNLTVDERIDVVDQWHEGARHDSASSSAFFTPWLLAMHVALECPSEGRILDLCSGIGTLSLAIAVTGGRSGSHEFTMVERNPDYCAVARKLMPDARIICGSVFDPEIVAMIGTGYDCMVSNPPFGTTCSDTIRSPRYSGRKFEYALLDLASDMADLGVAVIPQQSAPFRLTAHAGPVEDPSYRTASYERFSRESGLEIRPNLGIDTSFSERLWRSTNVRTEIAVCDFAEDRMRRNGTRIAA